MKSHQKIEGIKALRCMTRLLGKLGIKSCMHEYPPPSNWSFLASYPTVYYGRGLKECKDLWEKCYDRSVSEETLIDKAKV